MNEANSDVWTGGLTNDLSQVLLSEAQIAARVGQLGRQLAADYVEKDPLLVGILSGSFPFIADLVRAMNLALEVDFMAVSSYGDRTSSSGVVRILKDLNTSIAGRHVIVVEDIVDTGLTLHYLYENLRTRQPASLKVCALLDKREARKREVEVDYVGFHCPNEFVVGYGLDYRGRYRNLPFIGVLRPEVYRKAE
nr:hypoxanthine phosphoribosyltransferase [Nannocystis sp.]